MIAVKTVTVWRKRDGGKSFIRAIFTGVHAEYKRGNTASTVGPDTSDTLKVWFFQDPRLTAGDFVALGVKDSEKPSGEARMVRTVNLYSTRFRTHHVEVEAR